MRKYRLRIGLDVDDVLYRCNEYAVTLLRQKYGDLPELDADNIRCWGRQGSLLDERLELFRSPDFVREQPLYEGAQKFVRDLSKIADVFFVTSVPPPCMSVRAERLVADFPEVPAENILIGTRKDVIRLDVLLDDGAHNIHTSQASYPVLMRRPWNTDLSGLLAVNGYSDFYHLAKMIRNSFVEKAPDLSGGGVICLVGGTGTGKTAICASLTRRPGFARPVTSTTRPRRDGEQKNAYRFISPAQFLREKNEGRFMETTVYGGYDYGTSEEEIAAIAGSGRIAVLPIDVCGALTVRNAYRGRAVLVCTTRAKDAILSDILSRPIPDSDKIRRILALDYEERNTELCDFAVNYDLGADAAAERILSQLALTSFPKSGGETK